VKLVFREGARSPLAPGRVHARLIVESTDLHVLRRLMLTTTVGTDVAIAPPANPQGYPGRWINWDGDQINMGAVGSSGEPYIHSFKTRDVVTIFVSAPQGDDA